MVIGVVAPGPLVVGKGVIMQHREARNTGYMTLLGNGTPLQSSCLENPMDGGAGWAAVHGVANSLT